MTIKQMQCLLAYLGFYAGGLDGIWGPMSAGAEAGFRLTYGLDNEPLEAALLDAVGGKLEVRDPWEGVKWFKKEEFRCHCGGEHCDGYPAQVDARLLDLADRVREHFGAPMLISSGLRCPVHNQNVGGVANSRHMTGKAMDFRIRNQGSAKVLEYALSMPQVRYAYAIDGNYIHMDVE